MNINQRSLTLVAVILLFPLSVMAEEVRVQAGKVTITSSSDGAVEVNTDSTKISIPPDELFEDDIDLDMEDLESELLYEPELLDEPELLAKNESVQYQYSSCNGNVMRSRQQTVRTTGSRKAVIQRSVSYCP